MMKIRTTSFLLLLPLLVGSSSIPRSTSRQNQSPTGPHHYPPWNPSPKIDPNGFLTEFYRCIPGEWESEYPPTPSTTGRFHKKNLSHDPKQVLIRQVPGDGNCLFHSIATCLSLAQNRSHADMRNTTLLRSNSARLRQCAVDCLSLRPRRVLFLQGVEYLRAEDLVTAAASQYNLTAERYCDFMKQDSYWGGGPEIVALCNFLRRPIYVYELTENKRGEEPSGEEGGECSPNWKLRRMACFGSPKFDRREPLHILSADSRFPDITPGRQLKSGNHFMAVFPVVDDENDGGFRLRRGGGLGIGGRHRDGVVSRRAWIKERDAQSISVRDKGAMKQVHIFVLWELWVAKLANFIHGRSGEPRSP